MRYVLLIYRSEADSASMTQQELAELMQGHALFAREALARGILTGGAPLQPTSTATTVRVRDGKMLITDGPFAETKEQLAGTYVLNCKDLDEAIEMAARVPDAVYGSIEIRPVMEL
ncbi:MAG: YciI family protein [Chloroflexi bacterium]|nr:MAG: YciI family protein [Chloroflexota bacterium]